LIAAKQCVTADHIGEGRFALNVVCGWNEGEFEMFGATLHEHETRYEHAQEWLDAINWHGHRRKSSISTAGLSGYAMCAQSLSRLAGRDR
jgi:alkanesulfonate monooxygenase SsuD/methylene tetrahydromethanopterin reductase-like flavin-dependent oxidoreductase (luciferase family)